MYGEEGLERALTFGTVVDISMGGSFLRRGAIGWAQTSWLLIST